ncbi:hypothetical protein D9M71_391530 [compost metagenome]
MALLGVDEVGELERIADEEYGSVIAHHVPVALLGVELQGEATHVALGISGSEFTCYGGEAREQLGLLADFGEHRSLAVAGDVVGDDQGAIGAPALGMHDALGNALAVLMGQLLDQVVVLEQQRPARPGAEGILVVRNRTTGGRGENRLLAHATTPSGLD